LVQVNIFLMECEMGLTTHVLDTMHGTPAAGMQVEVYAIDGDAVQWLKRLVLNQDGRCAQGTVLGAEQWQVGRYRLLFDVAGYFRARGVILPEPPFLSKVPIDFGVADTTSHYHVPLLVSPWSYSTYRGS
jgi:5-hydroxyisourate hydrolase